MPAAPSALSAAELTERLTGALRATLFASNLRINPRRLQSIAAAAADSYRGFAAGGQEPAAAHAYGRSLAADGLGHAGALALVEALLMAAWSEEPATAAPPAALSYTSALLAGYMAAREEALLQEQERTRVALDRVRANGSPGA
jgi:hypothetical protein